MFINSRLKVKPDHWSVRVRGSAIILGCILLASTLQGWPQTKRQIAMTSEDLINLIDSAAPGDTIDCPGHATYDLTGLHPINIPARIVLWGNRDSVGTPGALLFTRSLDAFPLLQISADSVEIHGIRLSGPDTLRRTLEMRSLKLMGKYYSIPNSRGIQTDHDHLRVSNCEIYGWSHAGIFILGGATGALIEYNSIHHNQRSGLGYGIALKQSDATIRYNEFDWNRHSIAGTGEAGTSYHAYGNRIGPNANGHAFDMHGNWETPASRPLAGDRITIENNVFLLTSYPAVMIRGTPRLKAVVSGNRWKFRSDEDAVVLKNDAVNVEIHSNSTID